MTCIFRPGLHHGFIEKSICFHRCMCWFEFSIAAYVFWKMTLDKHCDFLSSLSSPGIVTGSFYFTLIRPWCHKLLAVPLATIQGRLATFSASSQWWTAGRFLQAIGKHISLLRSSYQPLITYVYCVQRKSKSKSHRKNKLICILPIWYFSFAGFCFSNE